MPFSVPNCAHMGPEILYPVQGPAWIEGPGACPGSCAALDEVPSTREELEGSAFIATV